MVKARKAFNTWLSAFTASIALFFRAQFDEFNEAFKKGFVDDDDADYFDYDNIDTKEKRRTKFKRNAFSHSFKQDSFGDKDDVD